MTLLKIASTMDIIVHLAADLQNFLLIQSKLHVHYTHPFENVLTCLAPVFFHCTQQATHQPSLTFLYAVSANKQLGITGENHVFVLTALASNI